MKLLISSLFLLINNSIFSQLTTIEATILTGDLAIDQGKAVVFTRADSLLVKGEYLDSSFLRMEFNTKGVKDFFLRISIPGLSDTTINFEAQNSLIQLGTISLINSLALDEVNVSFTKPMFERTMDGISVNVDGTSLQQLNTLFDVLKASPRLTSPDDESIEIIGKGSPLILIDRQAIISNEELKAIPAAQIEKIEIITSPSAKYKAQGSGNGVIEVYTKNFSMEGYRVWLSTDGGTSTQLQPLGQLASGINFKRKKLTLNGNLGISYNSRNSYGDNFSFTTDGSNIRKESEVKSNSYNIWQNYNFKAAYQLRDKHKLTMGVNGYGSKGKWNSISDRKYYINDTLMTNQAGVSVSKHTWLNNSAFLNYVWETDTNNSYFEINLNYINKVSRQIGTLTSEFENLANSTYSSFNIRNDADDSPNVGELRINYEHNFDTTKWKLNVGASNSILLNGKKYDRYLLAANEWIIDPLNANSYNYSENITALFAEVSKEWNKIGFRFGLRSEFTDLNGFSNTLGKDIIDSNYLLPFPTFSIRFSPTDTIGIKVYYSSGIERPQFSNYDPFIRVMDSLNIEYGNPYLKPAYIHTVGLELDLFYSYNLSFNYSYTDKPESSLSFVRDNSFLTETTPWNADYKEEFNVSLDLPVEVKWLQGWNSVWVDYTRYYFTDEFERAPFNILTYGLYSYLNFILPKKFNITNRFNLNRWGDADQVSRANFNWGLRLTKKFLNDDLQVYLDVSNILPIKSKNESISGNYRNESSGQYQFTSFKLGLYYKFGRLKASANVQESSSGQSNRL